MRLRYRPPHFQWIMLLASILVALVVVPPSPAALAAAPTGAPTLLSPVGTTEAANPVLTWSAVAGAAERPARVLTGPSFASPPSPKDISVPRGPPLHNRPPA